MAGLAWASRFGRADSPRGRHRGWPISGGFGIAAALGAIGVLVFGTWTAFQFGGARLTTAIDDYGEWAAAILAAIACGIAARRHSGAVQRGWLLLAASAIAWSLGELVWSYSEVNLQNPLGTPSVADAGFLLAIPLAILGIVNFYSPPRGTSTRVRLWVDGAIVASALLFADWAIGLSAVWADPAETVWTKLTYLAYPAGNVLIVTVLVLAVRRARPEVQGQLLLLLLGLGANACADTAYAQIQAVDANANSVLYTGWVAGYLLIALAAMLPDHVAETARRERPVDLWQLALPWAAVPIAAAGAVALSVRGQVFDPVEAVLAVSMALLLTTSQILAHNESLTLLMRSDRDAAILNSVFDNAPLGVVRVSAEGKIIQCNPPFAAMLLASIESLVGTQLSHYFPPDEMTRMRVMLGSLSSGEVEALESDSEALRTDGSTAWLHWAVTVVKDSESHPLFFIAMFEDVTAKHETEVSATANVALLERLNRLKSEFLTMVSHEFRTALVGIQGFSELLKDQPQPDAEDVKAFATDIYNDATRMDEMVRKMLTLDRLESESTVLHVERLDVNHVVETALAAVRSEHPDREIATSLDPMQPEAAADANKFQQVIKILADNAIKYSPEGGQVSVSTHAEPGRVRVSVKDHGIGMPADFNEHFFGRYQWQADNPTSTVVGTGLGLPMARQLVEMHGGRIWFDSTPGVGSEFHFTIPTSLKARRTD